VSDEVLYFSDKEQYQHGFKEKSEVYFIPKNFKWACFKVNDGLTKFFGY
jgi:hypothetical protein